jgi:trans-2,3-dihydro-3-hydroxyanthranilate isomerase
MSDRPNFFYIVDVFAARRYSGNPLAVVVAEHAMSDEAMQQLATEINYSETTFVDPKPDGNGAYRVRMFTPAREIAFAGHPILGTAWVVRDHIQHQKVDSVLLTLPASRISVTFKDDEGVAWFSAPPISLGTVCSRELMAAALQIFPDDIEPGLPVQQVSAGTSALIVPLCNLDALRRSKLVLQAFSPLAKQGFPPLVYVFCRETVDPANDLSARFFFEANGVREDPATGNGAAFLGAYLLKYKRDSQSPLSLRIEQGKEVNRPSLVLLRARMRSGVSEIEVGGSVIPIVRGNLL